MRPLLFRIIAGKGTCNSKSLSPLISHISPNGEGRAYIQVYVPAPDSQKKTPVTGVRRAHHELFISGKGDQKYPQSEIDSGASPCAYLIQSKLHMPTERHQKDLVNVQEKLSCPLLGKS